MSEETPFVTFVDVDAALAGGNATTCVWCHKAMLVSEADEYGRCEFDAQFPFTSDGKAEALQARGEIAIIMILKGILP